MCARVTRTERSGAAGTDAERRAARALADGLRARGREARVATIWVRTAWWLPLAVASAIGVAGSILAIAEPVAGLALVGLALLAVLAELSPWPPLRRLTIARATQNVVSPPPQRAGERPVTLILTAAVDLPRRSWAARVPGGVPRWLVVALVLLVACAIARVAGIDAGWLGVVQLPPTLVLLGAIVALLDTAGAEPEGDDSAVRAALAALDVLDADPPARLDVALLLEGAGGARHAGLRRWLTDRRRRGLRARDVALLALEPCPAGAAVWWERDGTVLPAALHPQLRTAARTAAAARPALAARPVRGIDGTAAAAARAGRWPSLTLGARPPAPDGALEGPEAVAALAVEVVRALDAELAG